MIAVLKFLADMIKAIFWYFVGFGAAYLLYIVVDGLI